MRHTATLLQDGRVLVVGGYDYETDEGASATAEVWDPETGQFRSTGKLAEGRSRPTATLLADGRVLVMGGDEGLRSAEVWDPATETFDPAGSSAAPQNDGIATLLLDGRVLYVGGSGDILAAEVWDPATETFGPAGSLGSARASHSATLLPDGRVLVVGGGSHWDDASSWLVSAAEIWDPLTPSFGPAASLPGGRGSHTATALPDGRVLVIGGMNPLARVLAEAMVWAPSDG